MKQNLLPARRATLVVVTVLAAAIGANSSCVTRSRQFSPETANPSAPAATSSKVNINTASAGELEKLPGVGDVLAERIVSHRKQHGPFRRPEHLMMVRGISERKFREFQPMITVD